MTDRDVEKVKRRIKANNVRIAQQEGLPFHKRDLRYVEGLKKRNAKLTAWLKSKSVAV